MTRDELLELLSWLRCAPVGRARLRAPHKPLLLLWLFGRFAASGSTVTAYADAEEPVSALINDYGPPVAADTLHVAARALRNPHLLIVKRRQVQQPIPADISPILYVASDEGGEGRPAQITRL